MAAQNVRVNHRRAYILNVNRSSRTVTAVLGKRTLANRVEVASRSAFIRSLVTILERIPSRPQAVQGNLMQSVSFGIPLDFQPNGVNDRARLYLSIVVYDPDHRRMQSYGQASKRRPLLST